MRAENNIITLKCGLKIGTGGLTGEALDSLLAPWLEGEDDYDLPECSAETLVIMDVLR
jgi:hypothetical protein